MSNAILSNNNLVFNNGIINNGTLTGTSNGVITFSSSSGDVILRGIKDPVSNQDAATKKYVDDNIGISSSVSVTNDNTTNATMYPTWVTSNTGNLPIYVSSSKFTFNPSSSTITIGTENATSTIKASDTNSSTQGGNIRILSGAGTTASSKSGNVIISSSDGTLESGNVIISTGSGDNLTGDIILECSVTANYNGKIIFKTEGGSSPIEMNGNGRMKITNPNDVFNPPDPNLASFTTFGGLYVQKQVYVGTNILIGDMVSGSTRTIKTLDTTGTQSNNLSISTGSSGVSSLSGTLLLNTGTVTSGTVGPVVFQTGGITRTTISTTSITNTLPIIGLLGSTSDPSYSFTGDTNTGIYSSAADTLNISTGGVERMSFNSDGTVNTYSNTSSTSNITGALKLIGGIGINNTQDATSSSNGGTFTTAGGAAIGKNLYVGTNLNVTGNTFLSGKFSVLDTTDATSVSTGSITSSGGLGIAKQIFCTGITPNNTFGFVYSLNNQPITKDTITFLTTYWGTPTITGESLGALTYSSDRFNINKTGTYIISCRVVYDNSTSNFRSLQIVKNTFFTDGDTLAGVNVPPSNLNTGMSLCTIAPLVSGDYIRIMTTHDSTTTPLNVLGTLKQGFFSIYRVG